MGAIYLTNDEVTLEGVRKEVLEMCNRFPVYQDL